MAKEITAPYKSFFEADGSPLESGYIYIGEANQNPEAVPITTYWDENLTIPAAQPIRTIGGYPSRSGTPGKLFASSDYSITVKNKNSVLIYTLPSQPLREVTDLIYSADNIEELLSMDVSLETVNVKGYYAENDGGGDIFNYDVSQAATNNGGTIIDGWVRQYNDSIKVEWFGIKGDGTTDNTSLYSSMISGLNEGTMIEWDGSKSYKGDFVSDKSFILKGNDTTIIPVGTNAIKFEGAIGGYTALSAAPAYGDTSLSGTSGLTGDTYIALYSGTLRPSDSAAVNYEIVKSRSDGTLYDKVYSNQNGGTHTYAVLTELSGVNIDGFNIEASTLSATGVFCRYVANISVSNIKMTGGTGATVSIRYSHNATVSHVQRIQPSATASGQGYNVQFNVSKYSKATSIYGEEVRHDFDQDSAYVTDVSKVISIGCIASAIETAHNGFAGYTTVKDCVVTRCDASAINASSQGVADDSTITFRECVIDNIKITNSKVRNASSFYAGIYFQFNTENLSISNVSLQNLSSTVFNYPASTYNSSYYCIRIRNPLLNTSITNVESDIGRAVVWFEEISSVNSVISIDAINVGFYESIVAVHLISADLVGDVHVSNLRGYETSSVYGRAFIWILSASNRLNSLMISSPNIIPEFGKMVSYANNTIGTPKYSFIDTAGFTKKLSNLNGLIGGDTITQQEYLTRGTFGIWSATSITLDTTEPFERPVAVGNTFGILNYSGADTITIPANSETVTNTSDLVLAAGNYYEFQANSTGNKWTLMRVQTGMTLT